MLTIVDKRPYTHRLSTVAPWCHDKGRDVSRATVRQQLTINTLKKEGEKGVESEGGRGKREGYCLLPTSSSLFAPFFWEWHQQPTQGASLSHFFLPFTFSASLQAFTGPFLLVSDFPLRWNYLFCLMCPHASHTHSMTYYTYNWIFCVWLSGCCKTTSWRDFLMMLRGTFPTSCPCESLSLLNTLIKLIYLMQQGI